MCLLFCLFLSLCPEQVESVRLSWVSNVTKKPLWAVLLVKESACGAAASEVILRITQTANLSQFIIRASPAWDQTSEQVNPVDRRWLMSSSIYLPLFVRITILAVSLTKIFKLWKMLSTICPRTKSWFTLAAFINPTVWTQTFLQEQKSSKLKQLKPRSSFIIEKMPQWWICF